MVTFDAKLTGVTFDAELTGVTFDAKFTGVTFDAKLTGVTFDAKFWHSKITSAGTGLIEGCNRRKCFYCLFIEMECILLRFPTYVIVSSLAEIVKIENARISN